MQGVLWEFKVHLNKYNAHSHHILEQTNKNIMSKKKVQGQQWFNEKYSKEEVINIDNRELDLVCSLKIENFKNEIELF